MKFIADLHIHSRFSRAISKDMTLENIERWDEAMITTAMGLSIAIPLYITYNYFIARIKVITQEWTDYLLKLVEVIGEQKRVTVAIGEL